MKNNTPFPLLKLPPELLALLSQYLPYQSTLRLLATCRYLRPLLSRSELASLRLKDGDEVYKIELASHTALTSREDPDSQSQWDDLQRRAEQIPCYACFKWLDRKNQTLYFNCSHLFVHGRASSLARRRRCVPCQVQAGCYEKGSEVSRFWRLCGECGSLAWKGYDRSVEKPEEARWTVANRYCNRCVGEQGEHLEELRMKNEPKYREKMLRKEKKALRKSGKKTEKRRDEELDSAWDIVDVVRLFAKD